MNDEEKKEKAAPPADRASAPGTEPETARQVFGRRVDRYAELDVFSEEKFYRPLLALADPRPGERALDVAAGTGLLASLLAREVAEVVGADVTPQMLDRARARIKDTGQKNISFIEAEVSSLPFPESHFDLVTCRTAFHHFFHPGRCLREINRVLRQGGRFVLEDVYGPEDDVTRATRERLEKLFDPSQVLAYRPGEIKLMLAAAGFRVEREVKPSTEDLSLQLILKLEQVEDPENRDEITGLLKDNLDIDLGGFSATEADGELVLHWRTVIIAAIKT
ncbi:MAG: class I SAM-dependent methyltransferase [Thermoleophilia bacterium]